MVIRVYYIVMMSGKHTEKNKIKNKKKNVDSFSYWFKACANGMLRYVILVFVMSGVIPVDLPNKISRIAV